MSETLTSPPSPKRLALFLDGTWNTVTDNTNVWRLKSLCQPDADQLIYYSAGVGTQRGEKVFGGMFGWGLDDEVIEAYEWLIQNYNANDELFIFGFSRGAYTARSLSGFISKCGLLQPGAPLAVGQLYERYQSKTVKDTIRHLAGLVKSGMPIDSFPIEERWMLEYSTPIPIRFVGVWDTVGALGIPYGNIPVLSRSNYQFLDTDIHINNSFAYHALAIDEQRASFAPTLWTRTIPRDAKPADVITPRPIEGVEQRWFIGAHANVGGGYRSDVLAQLPLKWLMNKAQLHGLKFRKDVVIDGDENKTPIADSYGDFAKGAYRFVSARYYRPIGDKPTESQGMVTSNINETIDASVFDRWRNDPTYRPYNLRKWAKTYGVDPASIQTSVRADDPKTIVAEPELSPTPRKVAKAPKEPPVN